MTTKVKYPEQDKKTIGQMIDFYGRLYAEVYLIHCDRCKRVVGVECAPAMANDAVDERGRTLFTYEDLLLARRTRLDQAEPGVAMIGYECVCGNNSKLGVAEQGEVYERSGVEVGGQLVQTSESGRVANSPFERAQIATTVRLKAASTKPDYSHDGTTQRFETFSIERVK